jgi:hypothetical protein
VAGYNLTGCDLFGDMWVARLPDYDPWEQFDPGYDPVQYLEEEDDSNPFGEISGGQFQQP